LYFFGWFDDFPRNGIKTGSSCIAILIYETVDRSLQILDEYSIVLTFHLNKISIKSQHKLDELNLILLDCLQKRFKRKLLIIFISSTVMVSLTLCRKFQKELHPLQLKNYLPLSTTLSHNVLPLNRLKKELTKLLKLSTEVSLNS